MRRKAILIIHGFAGGTYDQEFLANKLELIEDFDVFSFTLPGHDKFSAKGIKESDWIEAAESHVEELIKNGYDNIYLIGHSMGGVISCYLAGKYKEIQKLVLAAPAFECIASKDGKIDVIKSLKQSKKIVKRVGGLKGVLTRFIKFPISIVKEFQKLITDYQKAPTSINVPILIIHGMNDDMVPYESSIKVFNEIPHTNKKLVISKSLIHNVFNSDNKLEISKIVIEFLKSDKTYNNEIINIK